MDKDDENEVDDDALKMMMTWMMMTLLPSYTLSFTDECEDCEEAWEYVEFLKEKVSKKVFTIIMKVFIVITLIGGKEW